MLLDRTNTLGAGMGHLSKLEEPPEEPDYGLEPVEPPPPPTPSEEPAPPTAPARYGHSQCAEEAPVDTAHLPSAGMASAQLAKIKVWASMARDSDVTIPMALAWTTYLLSFTSFSFLSPLLWVGVWAIFGFSARSAFGTPMTKRAPFTEHDVESFVPQMVRAINLALEAYQDVIEAHDPKKALAVAVSFAVTSQLLAYISAPLLLFAAVNVACGYHLLCQNETAYFALSEGALAARNAALQLSTVQTMRSHASKLWELWILVAFAALSIWAYCLSWSAKLVTLGFGLLALNASGSLSGPEVKYQMKQVKKTARRMTLCAGEMFLKATTPPSKGSKAL